MRILFIIILLFTAGCMLSPTSMVESMYSVSETGESAFDGAKWVRVKSIWCDPVTFDLYQDTNLSDANLASLEINIGGTHLIRNGSSLHLNIDGKFTDLSTLDQLTNIETKPGYYSTGVYSGLNFYLPPYNISSKRYLVDMGLLEEMAKAENLVMRIDLSSEYMDLVCSNEMTSGSNIPAASTSYGIKKFLGITAQIERP